MPQSLARMTVMAGRHAAPVAALALLLVFCVLASDATTGRAQGAGDLAAARATGKVPATVIDALGVTPRVRVLVALQPPAALRRAGPFDRAALKREVGSAQDRVLAALGAQDFQTSHRYQGVAGLAGAVSPAGLARLASLPDVASITLDGEGGAALAQSVPLIRADVAHTAGYTGAGVTVAVLDSGADLTHPDLAGSITVQECFLSGAPCPVTGTSRASGPGAAQDNNGHGTNVSGIITSDGIVAPIGVAPGAAIAEYKVLDAAGNGLFSDWVGALSDIIANHPEVRAVNMSLVTFVINFSGSCDAFQPLTTTAIDTLRAAGTLTFVSSGNDGSKNSMSFPACVSSAVSVGAVYDQTFASLKVEGPGGGHHGCTATPATVDVPTCFSQANPTLDVLAPGAAITSSGLGGGTSTYIGTSQAAPHAVGVAALMLQANPSLTAAQVEARMKVTGVPRTDPANGQITPRVDAYAAATYADTDGDGMPDGYESARACLSAAIADAGADADTDGISNTTEMARGTNPCSADSDTDGIGDATDNCPTISNSGQQNTADRDFIDLAPFGKPFNDITWPYSDTRGDACDTDSDNDGLNDASELALSAGTLCPAATGPTNPLVRDTDGDQTIDSAECLLGTDPTNAASKPLAVPAGDTDHDGLPDLTEYFIGTDPALVDTDGDKIVDGVEVRGYNSNPFSTNGDGDACGDGKEIGSLNADTKVNSSDQLIVAQSFSTAPNPPYLAAFDVNKDSKINSGDLLLQAKVYGSFCP